MEPNEWLHRYILAQYIFRMLTFPQAHYYLRARSDKSKTTSRNRVFFSDHHQCIRLWNIFGVEFDEHHHSVFDWCEWFLLRLLYMCERIARVLPKMYYQWYKNSVQGNGDVCEAFVIYLYWNHIAFARLLFVYSCMCFSSMICCCCICVTRSRLRPKFKILNQNFNDICPDPLHLH